MTEALHVETQSHPQPNDQQRVEPHGQQFEQPGLPAHAHATQPLQALELCKGQVMHARMRPFVHRFFYRVFCLRLRIDQPQALARFNSWLFGINCTRLVSFWSKDHGDCDGSDLYAWIKNKLIESGVQCEVGAVYLQCFPRMMGYVFNPVSFWFIHDKEGVLRAMLAEVNNTFGQRHQYLLTAPGQGAIDADTRLACVKVFHVSPFCAVQGHYLFKYTDQDRTKRVVIDYYDSPEQDTPMLLTAITTQSGVFTTRRLLAALVSMPMMTLGVMFRIHLQAFKLWRKGARYHPLPALPQDTLTTNHKKVQQ